MRKKGDSSLYNVSVLPFNKAILLWSVRTWNLMNNAIIGKKRLKGSRGEFTTTIRSKSLNFSKKLCLNHGFKLNKDREHVRFMFKQVQPCITSIMIYKHNILAKSINRTSRNKALYIRMNQFKGMSSNKLRAMKGQFVHFSMKTGSTMNHSSMSLIFR